MAIGTGLAIGLGAMSIGSSVASSVIGSRASGKAAQAQERAGERSLAFQREQYNDGKARMQPWIESGHDGRARLSSLLGPTGNPTRGGAPASPPMRPMQGGGAPLSTFAQGGMGAGRAMVPGGPGGMVTIEAPTGERRQVPEAQAKQFIARGARMVS
jgi:hypothetical protein